MNIDEIIENMINEEPIQESKFNIEEIINNNKVYIYRPYNIVRKRL